MDLNDELDPSTSLAAMLMQFADQLNRIEAALKASTEPAFSKEWFNVAESAEILDKAPFTVREWARLGRINAIKRPSGRGRSSEWMISKREIERIKNKGLLPRNL